MHKSLKLVDALVDDIRLLNQEQYDVVQAVRAID
jgi:hypothetical protein